MSNISVLIEGAGIAGQVLHRELVIRGIPSVLKDRLSFPRDKVCGGILQPESWEYLRSAFSLEERIEEVPTIAHIWRGRLISRVRLPRPLIFVPRLRLDAAMYRVREEWRVESGEGRSHSVTFMGRASGTTTPHTPHSTLHRADPTIVIRATGAHSRGPWIGFQAELQQPIAGLEMHYGRGIYMGISPADGGSSHAAFIVRKEKVGGDIVRLVKDELGVELKNRPKGTGQIHYGDSGEAMAVGDAKMTTHPFLGLGMKHAILSARLMADLIEKGRSADYATEHRKTFAKMRLASSFSARLYESEARLLLWPILRFPSLFLPAYHWLHK